MWYRYYTLANQLTDYIFELANTRQRGERQKVSRIKITLHRKVAKPLLSDVEVECSIRYHDVGMLPKNYHNKVFMAIYDGLKDAKSEFKDTDYNQVMIRFDVNDISQLSVGEFTHQIIGKYTTVNLVPER